MDSKAINKLIRSEVWPILREQGFSHFESRNGFSYQGPFINVVNFQSFNSYLADGLGCTTYSFTVRLGVYVIGSPSEDRVGRDKAGRLLPLEYQCSFRGELRKRTPVDGFERDDIFYIHPDGQTTGQCFQEVRHLLSEFAPSWFRDQNDLDGLIARMRRAEDCASVAGLEITVRPGSRLWEQLRSASESSLVKTLGAGNPGAYTWNELLSLLLLRKHRQSPSLESASVALDSINRVIGDILDYETIQRDRPGEEEYAYKVRELWDQLGDFRPVPVYDEKSITRSGCLDGPIWKSADSHREGLVDFPNPVANPSARKEFWPILKSAGFSEFTDRVAHRVSNDLIEVVEFLPMDPGERKAWNLPSGLFRIGVGVFWPLLRQEGLFRKNRKDEARPTVNECHISNWLAPEVQTYKNSGTAFHTVEDAQVALTSSALAWLDVFRNSGSALSMLQRKDWELFWSYPMMRGYGARSSSRRLMYIAILECLLGRRAQSEGYIRHAEAVLPAWYNEHYGSRQRAWMDQVKARLGELESLARAGV